MALVTGLGLVLASTHLIAASAPGDSSQATDCCDGQPVLSTYVGTGEAGSAAEGELRYRAAIAEPYGLACDAAGNLYFSDYENNRIGRVDANSGEVTTLAEVSAPQGLALDGQNLLYVGTMVGEVWQVDLASGRTELAAGGGTLQEASGDARSIALGAPAGVAVDRSGALYIADSGLHAVFRMDPRSRQLTVIAGKRGVAGFAGDGAAATDSTLNGPSAMAVAASGDLYVADADNHIIRVVDHADGTIRTVAGTAGDKGFAGDGAATGIRFNWPQDLQFNGPQTLLIADVFNHRVRQLDLATGVVKTIVGKGPGEYQQENVAGIDAAFPTPIGIAVGPGGELYVSSPRGQRIVRLGAPFTVPPPWYLSPWAWLGALLALGSLLYGASELRARQLRTRARALEAEVERRTQALADQRAQVDRQSRRLRKLASTRQELLTRVSREFREPLTEMLRSLQRSRNSGTTQEQSRYLDTAERNANRLLRLVDHMRGLAGLSRQHDEQAPVAALPVVRQLIDSFEPIAAEHGVILASGRLEPLVLQSTVEAFETIAVNFISNAIKYTPAGGSVSVDLESRSGIGVLVVADTGRGIAPDDLERVFQPFERAHDEGERIPGSGLGLAIVREQAESCGGRIELESEPGRGSTFRVYLPLAARGEAGRESAGYPGNGPVEREIGSMRLGTARIMNAPVVAGAAATVLVVEDSPDMRRHMVDVLATQFRCLEADDGNAAVAIATQEMPDLVVCDVMLPGQDGFAVCRELKGDERTSHIAVVLLTALADTHNRLSGLAERADDYLSKPFGEQELLLRIRNLLDLRTLLQRRYARDLRFERRLPEGLGERDRAFLTKVGRYLDSHYQDMALDLKAMATALAISERQLQRKLKALTGLSPSECLRDYRLQRAHERLVAGQRPGDVATNSGFGSQAHFSVCFRARFGYSPSEALEHARRRV